MRSRLTACFRARADGGGGGLRGWRLGSRLTDDAGALDRCRGSGRWSGRSCGRTYDAGGTLPGVQGQPPLDNQQALGIADYVCPHGRHGVLKGLELGGDSGGVRYAGRT